MLEHYRAGDTLTQPDTAAVRDLINDIIAGRLKNGGEFGQEVVLRSCHDLDEARGAPPHSPGHRHFDLAVHLSHPEAAVALLRLSAFEPGSDHIRVPVDVLLGTVSATESSLGAVHDVADSVCDTSSHSERRDLRRTLREIERAENERADAFRAMAAQPSNWPAISGRAFVHGRVIALYAANKEVS
jgi:hypothetical protein